MRWDKGGHLVRVMNGGTLPPRSSSSSRPRPPAPTAAPTRHGDEGASQYPPPATRTAAPGRPRFIQLRRSGSASGSSSSNNSSGSSGSSTSSSSGGGSSTSSSSSSGSSSSTSSAQLQQLGLVRLVDLLLGLQLYVELGVVQLVLGLGSSSHVIGSGGTSTDSSTSSGELHRLRQGETCQANGCYGGYYCNTKTDGCHPTSTCGSCTARPSGPRRSAPWPTRGYAPRAALPLSTRSGLGAAPADERNRRRRGFGDLPLRSGQPGGACPPAAGARAG